MMLRSAALTSDVPGLSPTQINHLFHARATFEGAQEKLSNLADNEPTSAWVWKSAAETVLTGAALLATALVPNTDAFVGQTTDLATQLLTSLNEGLTQPPAVLSLAKAVFRQAEIGVKALITELTAG